MPSNRLRRVITQLQQSQVPVVSSSHLRNKSRSPYLNQPLKSQFFSRQVLPLLARKKRPKSKLSRYLTLPAALVLQTCSHPRPVSLQRQLQLAKSSRNLMRLSQIQQVDSQEPLEHQLNQIRTKSPKSKRRPSSKRKSFRLHNSNSRSRSWRSRLKLWLSNGLTKSKLMNSSSISAWLISRITSSP